jgi:hypothetical protein
MLLAFLFTFSATATIVVCGRFEYFTDADEITVTRCIFQNLQAIQVQGLSGGAVWVHAPAFSLTDSVFMSCIAGIEGGGICVDAGIVAGFSRCCASNCSAGRGGMFFMRSAVEGSDATGWPITTLYYCQVFNCQTSEQCDGTVSHEGPSSIFCRFLNVTECQTAGAASGFQITSDWTFCEVLDSTCSAIGGTIAFSCRQKQPTFERVNFFANSADTVLEFLVDLEPGIVIELKSCCFFSNTGADLQVTLGTVALENCQFSKEPGAGNLVGDPIVTDTEATAGVVVCQSWVFEPSSEYTASVLVATNQPPASEGLSWSAQVEATNQPGNSHPFVPSSVFGASQIAGSGTLAISAQVGETGAPGMSRLLPPSQVLGVSNGFHSSAAIRGSNARPGGSDALDMSDQGGESRGFAESHVAMGSSEVSPSGMLTGSEALVDVPTPTPSASDEFTVPARLYQVRRRIRLGYLFVSMSWIF